jgi:hypothetical protein
MRWFKRDWLARRHRLKVAELAILWLGEEEIDARRFGCACTVIERYLLDGGPETARIHDERAVEEAVVSLASIERIVK